MKKQIACWIDGAIKDALDKLRQDDGRSVTYHIGKALKNYLKSKKLLKD